MIIRIEHGTLFSLRVQGAAVTKKVPDKNQIADEPKNYEYDHRIRRGEGSPE